MIVADFRIILFAEGEKERGEGVFVQAFSVVPGKIVTFVA